MADIDFQSNVGLVHHIARKLYGWTQALNVGLSYDDVFQEASLAFVKASRGFNPEEGVKFSAYFTRAAYNQMRATLGIMTGAKRLNDSEKEALAELKTQNEGSAANGEKQESGVFIGLKVTHLEDMVAEDGLSPLDSIPSDEPTPEEIVSAKQSWWREAEKLSPLALVMADMLADPPLPLLKELEQKMAHAEYCCAQGFASRVARPGITIKAIADFIRLVSDIRMDQINRAENELLCAAARL